MINPAVEIAFITAVPPTVVALGAVILGVLNRTKLTDVGVKLDGRLTELLELTRKTSHADGVLQERNDPHLEPPSRATKSAE